MSKGGSGRRWRYLYLMVLLFLLAELILFYLISEKYSL